MSSWQVALLLATGVAVGVVAFASGVASGDGAILWSGLLMVVGCVLWALIYLPRGGPRRRGSVGKSAGLLSRRRGFDSRRRRQRRQRRQRPKAKSRGGP